MGPRRHEQYEATADATIAALVRELRGYPTAASAGHGANEDLSGIAVPLRLRKSLGELSLINTNTVFGTPLDLTLAELAIEAFFPADQAAAAALLARAD